MIPAKKEDFARHKFTGVAGGIRRGKAGLFLSSIQPRPVAARCLQPE